MDQSGRHRVKNTWNPHVGPVVPSLAFLSGKPPSSSLLQRVEAIIRSIFICFLLFYHLQTCPHYTHTHTHTESKPQKNSVIVPQAAGGPLYQKKAQALTVWVRSVNRHGFSPPFSCFCLTRLHLFFTFSSKSPPPWTLTSRFSLVEEEWGKLKDKLRTLKRSVCLSV